MESRDRRHRCTQEVGPAVRESDGTDHCVTAATSKTESERRQAKKSNAEVIRCEGGAHLTPDTQQDRLLIMEKKKVLVVTKQFISYFTEVRRVKMSDELWRERWTRLEGQYRSGWNDDTWSRC